MKRLICLLLALGCLAALPGCRDHEERQEMRRQLDYANGYAQPETYADCALNDGTVLEEQVLCEKKGVTLTAMGIYEEEYCYCVPIRIRNDSGKRFYCFAYDAMTVDGWAVYGDFWLEVVSGGMDDGILQLSKDGLRYLDGQSIHEISGTVYGYFDEGDDAIQESFTIKLGEEAEETAGIPGTVVAEKNGVSLWYLETIRQDYFVTYLFCVETTSEAAVFLDFGDEGIVVNGDTQEPCFYNQSVQVPAGAKALYEVTLYDSDLEELCLDSFDDIVSLEFTLELDFDQHGIQTMPVRLSLEETA
ncbi:MAG: hypothetical protein ACI3VN_05810 [Candidatus Onthomonas sp.]